ncbi:hypothetical protein XENOCAPTIV_019413 [Xenoophorus captivus]|uniref:Pyruvate kinase n=1 Tax=Xenoophorus captivus TaxID=1517983 RepID=A0ABV0QJ55_9TELE
MLSGETAKGLFPLEAVAMMHSLFEELRRLTPLSSDPTEVTAIGAVESSFKCCRHISCPGTGLAVQSLASPEALWYSQIRNL